MTPNPILKFFEYSHLPAHLQVASRPLHDVAQHVEMALPDSAEKSAGLRKLLEAKDCFVRAALVILFCLLPSAFCLSADFPRGATRSPAHKLLAAPTHCVLTAPPAQYAIVPKQLDMWGNDQYGDCVSAEEAFAKACYSPEIFVSASEVETWARQNGYLSGADLVSVMSTMATDGFAVSGRQYDDGAYASVDYSNETILQSAIATAAPVKIAIDANALPAGAGNQQGWFAIGSGHFPNTDHCVSICGFGTAEYLYSQLSTPLPAALPGTTSGYLVFTWSTIGFVDHAWIMSTCTEAWLRSPTTVIVPEPTPPTPTPAPRRFSFSELIKFLISLRHPHLSPAQAAAVSDFFSDDSAPHVALLKTIVYRRGVEAGLICEGDEIGAINWQKLIALIVELEPLIVPLIPLLLGDEPQAMLAPLFTLCGAQQYRTECGPNGCYRVPVEPQTVAPRPTPPKSAAAASKTRKFPGKKRLFFPSRTK